MNKPMTLRPHISTEKPNRVISKTGGRLGWFFVCLYAATAQHGVSWQDSGDYQLRTIYRDILGANGLACAHPLYISFTNFLARILGGFLDIEVPRATTLASSLWMALALVIFYDTAERISRSRRAAILATLTLGFSHLAWWLSTIAEVYAMSLAFLMGEIWSVVRIIQGERTRSLYIQAAVLSGLGLCIHNCALLSIPLSATALALCAWHSDSGSSAQVRSRPSIALFLAKALSLAVVWLCSASMLLAPAMRNLAGGMAPLTVLRDLLFGNFGAQVAGHSTVSPMLTVANFGLAALSLSSPCWFVGLVALCKKIQSHGIAGTLRKMPPALCYIIAVLAFHAAFALRYRVPDQALFFLPTLSLASLLLAPLLSKVRLDGNTGSGRATFTVLAISTVLCAIAVPLSANAILHIPAAKRRILASRARLLPYRDEIRYWALPWKHNEDSAEFFAADAIATLDEMHDAVLYADSTSAPPLMLRSGDIHSPSWSLYTPWNDYSRFEAEAIEGREVYAVSPVSGYCPQKALETGNVKPLPR